MEYDVRWIEMPDGYNSYAAMMIFWDGAIGYMGSQFHADGTQMTNFAIWDANGTVQNSKPLSSCTRFGGEGGGSHCQSTQSIVVGRDYRFKVQQTFANATGVAWSVH
eukprot:TRINITY_DN548_c0_g1_i4.p3 TRINITY_DN548_c0_g1~~TRINITY_DN548_c0_g1_i4.p3  ORF type:complete len:107 (+),score=29.43 TRINITY_DN548_c0_g1_i4:159-479(+)